MLRRRNAVLVLMAVELMLNAVNLILVTADTTARAALPHGGQVFALFVIVLAAAEIGVGLAIVLQLYRLRATVAADDGTARRAGRNGHRGVSRERGGCARLRCCRRMPLAAALLGLALTLLSENAGRTARRAAIGLGVTGAAGRARRGGGAAGRARRARPSPSGTWVDFGGLAVTLGVRLDGTAALVAVAVAAVALAVQVYSTAYLGPAPTTTRTPTGATCRTPRRSASSPRRCCWWWSPVT